MRVAFAFALTLLLCPVRASLATDVNLDPTFGTFGKVVVDVLGGGAAQDVLVQADGAIVAVGFADNGVGLVRVTAAGVPDATFGTGGVVTTDVGGGSANVVAQQADGKLVIAGYADGDEPAGNASALVARYAVDGTLDTTFGGTGIVKIDLSENFDLLDGLAIQADGKIVVAGFVYENNIASVAVLRFLTDGTLDSGFGTGGLVTTTLPNGSSGAGAVAIQSDGKIVVAGKVAVAPGNQAFLVLRYAADGTPDSGFGSGGAVITDFAFDTDIVNGVAVLPDGKIVAGGHHGGRFAATRYLADGTPDGTFGVAGKAILDLAPGFDIGFDMVVQPDGRIVLAGYAQPNFASNRADLAVVRLDTAGAPDATFAPGGGAVLVIDADSTAGIGVARQSDGKLVIGGWLIADSSSSFLIVRLGGTCGDGTVDASEQCDDANTDGLDCCSPGCGNVAAGDPCELDGNICTADVCDGAGTCTLGGPVGVCRAPTVPRRSKLTIVDAGDDSRDRLDWKWAKGGAATPPEFGLPATTTNFSLCIFAGPGSAPPLVYKGDIPANPLWESTSETRTRLRYEDPTGANDGFVKAYLQGGHPLGDAKVLLKAKGGNVAPPPLELATPVTVQLRGDNGSCFGATFATPSTNSSTRFRATGQ